MRVRFLVASVLTSLLFQAGVEAQAEPVSCASFKTIVGDASTGFSSLRGIEEGEDLFAAEFKLDGATQCSVDVSRTKSYSCSWRFAAGEVAGVTSRVKELAEPARTCFPDWRGENLKGQKITAGRDVLIGFALKGSAEHANVSVRIFAEEVPQIGSRVVTFEVMAP